jgi:nitroreductase
VTLSPDELLTTTRAVRRRLDLTRPVPLALVRECLEVALQAPTGGNRQQWHWVVVTDPDLRRGVGEYYRRSFAAYLDVARRAAAAYADPGRRAVQERFVDSGAYLGDHMGDVPVLVLACLEVGDALPDGNQAGLWGSRLPAAWSYQLAARARGLGTAWTTRHLVYEQEVADLLGIPPHVRQGVLLPTTYYTGETFRPAPREPLSRVLHLDRW